MSNARDKANIPALNFSSTGIDDNATSTAITIDSSERVGIGTSSPNANLEVSDASTPKIRFARGTSYYWDIGHTSSNFQFESQTGGVIMHMNFDGNVGIGTDSPATKLDVNGGLNCGFLQSSSSIYATSGIFRSSDGSASSPSMQPGVDNDTGFFRPASNAIGFTTAGSERMRILDAGQVKIGTPIPNSDLPGYGNNDQGVCFRGGTVEQFFINSNATPAFIGRTIDGSLVAFQSAGTQEGSISVSGSTVSYNGFTGTHWSRFTDNSTPNILKGTVLESLDEMCDWYNLEFDVTNENGSTYSQRVPHVLTDGQSVGDTVAHTYEGTDYQATIVKETDIKHVKSKVSDTVDAKNVYGVFIDYDNDGEGYNDFYVASVGSFVVRIKANETIAKGDLLQSNGDGTAKVQTDDAVRSSSFAKVLSTTIIETYEDGSYLVPCSLMC